MSDYIINDEVCKLLVKVPLKIFNLICKDRNIYGEINPIFIRNLSIAMVFFVTVLIIILYFLFFNKNTTLLYSNKNVGVMLTVCLILSIYFGIMSILEEGEYGMDGEKGFAGDPGDPGPQGKLGHLGLSGEMGNQGINGGSGPIGNIGPTGNIGPMGVRGIRGKRGVKGRKGYKGLQGDKGVSGKPGAPGIQGPKGEKGEDNRIIYRAAKGGDSNIPYPVYTYDSEFQSTKWLEPYPFFNIKKDKKFRNKCQIENSTVIENKTYNECVSLCNNDIDNNGYLKCVGIYGEIDPNNPNTKRGKCFICPERKETLDYVKNNRKLLESANQDPSSIWGNFITGIRMKSLEDNDSAHAYLTNIFISNKE